MLNYHKNHEQDSTQLFHAFVGKHQNYHLKMLCLTKYTFTQGHQAKAHNVVTSINMQYKNEILLFYYPTNVKAGLLYSRK